MRLLRAFGAFWYDFIIGDDWKIAVAVVSALLLTTVATVAGLLGDTGLTVLGAVLILGLFALTVVVDTRSRR